jgi:formylglycine-generating enzyme required for sulfatase activity
VLIAAGNFVMGDDEESPRREVYVDAFYLDKYEVTTARYAKFFKATGSVRVPDYWEEANLVSGELPVVGVDWRDADAYCRWAGKRLPTEAEWEKGARGADGRKYPWGDAEPTPALANFGRSSANPYQGGLAPVGGHEAGKSPYGVHDLADNASEWVADWFTDSVVTSDVTNPKGPDTGTTRVIRGGAWDDPIGRVNATRRMYASPYTRSGDVGFRCAMEVRR